jgi:serine phosphatase RsbU (regulator of sigma subunit)
LGNLYRNSGEFKKAEEHLKSALQISKELNALSILKDQEKYIYLLYDTIGNYNKALEHYKNFIAIKDSISNEENTRNNIKLQMQYEFEKKEALSLEENKREIQVLKEKEKRQTIFFYSIIGGFLALVVIAFLIFRNLKYTRQQNKIIQSKNKDILDSITYAKRIQEAILPSENIWNEALPNSFILYLPKDIVAGDFYWLETISVIANEERVKQSVNNEKIASPESLRSQNRNDIILFAACDCTGHGVPGAMVSVVCANALSKATIEEGITEPEKILERTSRIVVEKLNRNNEDVKDGMDISLCTINIKENNIYTLQWAGANNPLLIIRPTTYATEPSAPIIASEERTKQSTATKEEIASLPTVARNEENAVTSSVRPSANVSRSDSNYELIEYKPNKQPIGKMDMPQPFTRHTIELQKGDTIYVFTDGFADQFGGENNKKYMIKKLKIFLLSIAHLPLKEQKEKLAEEFNAWKGSNEQVDDVCVIGVKI